MGLLTLFPFLLLLSIFILFDSRGGVFYFQKRVGRNNRDFSLIKFRTMITGADKNGLITVGNNDVRITPVGKFLRKYKIDELPQLINILMGDMSFVGPRPEVRKYVEMYNEEQRKVLRLRPGLTELASLEYFHENEMLSKTNDPEKTYIEEIMPHKLALNLKYIEKQNFFFDLGIIFKTIAKIFS